MPDLHPGDLKGRRLERYWTKSPEGLAKWATHAHPWTALYGHLIKHVKNPNFAARLTETYFRKVFGIKSGWRKGQNPLGPG